MTKQALSLTLAPENLAWLKARAAATGARSLSGALDRLLEESRAGAGSAARRSVRGTVRIAGNDPGLDGADPFVRGLFAGGGLEHRAKAKKRG